MDEGRLVLMRNGESLWESRHIYSGWYDVNLSEDGEKQVEEAAKAIKKEGYAFEAACTSLLIRAQRTLTIILSEIDQMDVPIDSSWYLNERHSGGLTGLSESEVVARYGEEQFQFWMFSPDITPPPINKNHKYYYSIVHDRRYSMASPSDVPEAIPFCETFRAATNRSVRYWNINVVPKILDRKSVLIVAHDSTIRGLLQHLENLSYIEALKLMVSPRFPIMYQLGEDLEPLEPMQYIGNEEEIQESLKRKEFCYQPKYSDYSL